MSEPHIVCALVNQLKAIEWALQTTPKPKKEIKEKDLKTFGLNNPVVKKNTHINNMVPKLPGLSGKRRVIQYMLTPSTWIYTR